MNERFKNLGRALSKNEQKEIRGGEQQAGCECQGSIGEWIYNNETPTCYERYQDVQTYCRSGVAQCWGGCVNYG